MIKVFGRNNTLCDGVSRRSFVAAGALGFGGLTLADYLRLQANEQSTQTSAKAIVYVEQAGGPTHFETYDPKPDAPVEYRGPFRPIDTALPGVQFSELMVEQAKIADKIAVIRSMHHRSNSHDTSSHLTQTGYYKEGRNAGVNTFPSVGSLTAKLKGANEPGMPAYVSIPQAMRNGKASFVGQGFNPFVTGGDPNKSNFRVNNLGLVRGLSMERLEDRAALRQAFDGSRQMLDRDGLSDAMDEYSGRAYELVAGGRARRAFDIAAENDTVRTRYGRNTFGQGMLLARRLVEAGVTFVTVRIGSWDDHNKIDRRMKSKGPSFDRGVAALVEDLHERGMSQDVMVVAMGEFGRTPRVNRNAGRDHWGAAMSVLMAGGSASMGQIIGSSNRKGEVPASNPYRPENVLSTMYRHLGIDPATTILDHDGRPRYLLDTRDCISELV